MKIFRFALVIAAATSLSACGIDLSNECMIICF